MVRQMACSLLYLYSIRGIEYHKTIYGYLKCCGGRFPPDLLPTCSGNVIPSSIKAQKLSCSHTHFKCLAAVRTYLCSSEMSQVQGTTPASVYSEGNPSEAYQIL